MADEQIKEEKIYVFPAPPSAEQDNTLLKPLLDKIKAHGKKLELLISPDRGIDIMILEDLATKIALPFIETPDGARYYGLHSIEKYVTSLNN